ncbi:tyrosine-type recombinase/integrase [Nocardia sp. NPDC005366]|uniref:tyrosine-type recombinase/integrase n=1 Tax=Nocardia sp. NPDC005366 TaxID=3156878 RepID=UPI0033A50519
MVSERQGELRAVAGTAETVLASGVALLQPEETVLQAMLAGWAKQQAARLVAPGTLEQREQNVRRLVAFTNDYPWNWGPVDIEDWTAAMVDRGLAHSTIRHYQGQVALFLDYLTDARYRWDAVCEKHFGTHPVQVFHEWNTAVHRADVEARPGNRPMSRDELQDFFDYCDDRVAVVRRSGRKGWLAAFRDAAVFKTIYGWGLRRRETAMLDTIDWSSNAATPEFGRYAALSVRYGKAMRGSPPKRRSVLSTMGWAVEAVTEWVEDIRPMYGVTNTVMWPTERGGRITNDYLNTRFAACRDALGLPAELGPHCLRHSYISHLLEDGFDHLFVQQQVGHAWGSTTALYTSVGSDYKNKALRRALDRAFAPAPR